MKRRSLFFTLAAGLLALSLGGIETRAGTIPLPTTLDQLLPAGNDAVVGPEPDTFSSFKFSSSPIPPTTLVLNASGINVDEFHAGIENGLEFSGAMFAPTGTIVDYKISYVVTAPAGYLLNDALLVGTYNIPTGSTGTVSVGESLLNNATGLPIGSLSISNPVISDNTSFAGVQSILVKKDILLVGGNSGPGIGISIIDQGFSSAAVPEPASLALLGIGLSGLFTIRRFLKRAFA